MVSFLRARTSLSLGLSCTAMAVLITLIGTGRATADAEHVRIGLAAPAPEPVWRHADQGAPCAQRLCRCAGATIPRKRRGPGTYRVLWFAANSQGYFASETPGPDLAPADVTLARFRRLPDCARWVRSQPYLGSTPERYNTGLWMVAPFTRDGTSVMPSSTTNSTVNGRDHRAGARSNAHRSICRAITGTWCRHPPPMAAGILPCAKFARTGMCRPSRSPRPTPRTRSGHIRSHRGWQRRPT